MPAMAALVSRIDTALSVCVELVSDAVGVVRRLGERQQVSDQISGRCPVVATGPGNWVVAVGVDRRLAVLGRDYDERRFEEALLLQFTNPLANRSIHQLDLTYYPGAGSSSRIQISTRAVALLDQLLTNAD